MRPTQTTSRIDAQVDAMLPIASAWPPLRSRMPQVISPDVSRNSLACATIDTFQSRRASSFRSMTDGDCVQ